MRSNLASLLPEAELLVLSPAGLERVLPLCTTFDFGDFWAIRNVNVKSSISGQVGICMKFLGKIFPRPLSSLIAFEDCLGLHDSS